MHKITMLGTGLIGMFYTMTLHRQRGRDRVHVVYSPTKDHVKSFAEEWDIPKWTTDMAEAINDPETDVVVVGLPNRVSTTYSLSVTVKTLVNTTTSIKIRAAQMIEVYLIYCFLLSDPSGKNFQNPSIAQADRTRALQQLSCSLVKFPAWSANKCVTWLSVFPDYLLATII